MVIVRPMLVAFLLVTILLTPHRVGADDARHFKAHLSGEQTLAQGQANFTFSKDDTQLHFKLIVANIENVWMAHIHVAAEPGGNGPPVVWLSPDAPPPPGSSMEGRFNGVLAEGVVTADDGSLVDLKRAIVEGRAYVNVHTRDFSGETPPGPGNSPGGEIRGTIR